MKRHRRPRAGESPPHKKMVTAFYPLVYSSVPMSSARLVRIALDREVATTLGLDHTESNQSRAPTVILADVFVGDAGLARAVPFVRPVTDARAKEQQQ